MDFCVNVHMYKGKTRACVCAAGGALLDSAAFDAHVTVRH